MKKNVLLLLFVIINSTLYSQRTNFTSFSDGYKRGITKVSRDTNDYVIFTDTVIEAKYDDIYSSINGFLLITETKTSKKTPIVRSIRWVDSNLVFMREFENTTLDPKYSHQYVIFEKENKSHLFDFNENKIVLANCESISFIKTCKPNLNYDEYSQYQRNEEICEFTFIAYQKAHESGVLTVDRKLLFATSSNGVIKYIKDFKSFHHYQAKNSFDIYSIDGNLVTTQVTHVEKLKTTLIKNKAYYGYQHLSGKMSLGTNIKIYVDQKEASFVDLIADTNRFVAQLNSGFVVYDTNGNQINSEPYDMIQSIRISQATLVKKDGKGYLVDRDLKVLNTKPFAKASVIGDVYGDYVYYKTQFDDQEEKGFYLYNGYGRLELEQTIEDIIIPDRLLSSLNIIYVQKDNKYAISHDTGYTEFLYGEPEIITDQRYAEVTRAKKGAYCVLIKGNTEYFSEYHLTKIEATDFQDYSNELIFLYQGDKFSVISSSNFEQAKENKILKIGDLPYDNYKFNYQLTEYFEGVLELQKNKKWAIYNTYNDTLMTGFEFSQPLEVFKDMDIIKVFKNNKVGLSYFTYDSLSTMIPTEYDKITYNEDRMIFSLWKNNKMGKLYYDCSENCFIPAEYDEVIPNDELTLLVNNGLFGFRTYENKIIKPLLTKKPDYNFFEGNVILPGMVNGQKKSCLYYIDLDTVICYDQITTNPNLEGMFIITEQNRNGIINTYGDTILPIIFKSFKLSINQDYYLTELPNGKKGIRLLYNQIVIPEKYDELIEDKKFYSDIFLVQLNNRWGAIKNGSVQIPTEYEYIELNDDIIILQKNGNWSAVDFYFQPKSERQYNSKKELFKHLEH